MGHIRKKKPKIGKLPSSQLKKKTSEKTCYTFDEKNQFWSKMKD